MPNNNLNGSQGFPDGQQNVGANYVTPLNGPTGIYPNNPGMQQQGNQQQNMQQENQQVTQLLQQLVSEIQKQGVSLNSQNQNPTQAQDYASSNTGGIATSPTGSDYGDYDYFEVEQKLIREIQQIRLNANTYGPITEIVGRRASLSRGDNRGGRGNGYEFEYKLADGRIVSNDQAWELANAGRLKNIIGSHNHGRKYIRSVGDGVLDNNLGNLPSF